MQYKKTAVIKYIPLINCHENYRYSENYLKLPGQNIDCFNINPLTPNGHYSGRTAPLTSRRCILNIYSINIRAEYFKHSA
jgi:hypothetical protein